jgi:hypothetical protein
MRIRSPRALSAAILALAAALPAALPFASRAADEKAAPLVPQAAPAIAVTYSSPDVDDTPEGKIHFHGPFGRETFSASAEKLPIHDFVEISCDLLIIRTWDGSTQISEPDGKPAAIGPDFFRLGVRNGPTLLYTTFCCMPDGNAFKGDKTQNFPSQVPGDLLEPGAGAISKNKLGYNFPDAGPATLVPMSGLYHLHFVVPHHEGSVAFDFTGLNLQDLHDESWGVTDVEIRTLTAAQVPKPDAAAIEKAIATCAQADPATDLTGSFQTLVDGMNDTVAWMDKHLKPLPVDSATVSGLIQDFTAGDEKRQARDDAQRSLMQLGIQAEPALRDARNKSVGEVRLRIDWALMALDVSHIADDDLRKTMLATRALEIIGTTEALDLRRKLTAK